MSETLTLVYSSHICIEIPVIILYYPAVYNQDFVITRDPFFLEPDEQQACLEFEAIDDDVVEGLETVTFTITADGEVVGNISVMITDNDGMCS